MTKLQVGDMAPDFEAINDEGKPVRLSDFRGKKVILYFYPKDNTSGCTKQAVGFRDHYEEIVAHNAVVLGVSPDSVESHVKFKTKYDLPFQLLVDPDHKIAELYGVWGEKKMYGRTYYGIKRSHFVIDEEGRLIDVRYNVRPAKSVEYALKAIKGEGGK